MDSNGVSPLSRRDLSAAESKIERAANALQLSKTFCLRPALVYSNRKTTTGPWNLQMPGHNLLLVPKCEPLPVIYFRTA